jgi:DNA-binding GntR family transcriptional regulator
LNERRFSIDAPKSLATAVAERLREAIINGEFALGELIPEEALAASFGVSRTPVREALNQLQQLGLVVVRPQRGSFVFEPTEADVAAVCEFRSVLEPRAAELAWHHDRDGTVAALTAAIAEMKAARTQRDKVRYSRADTRLHESLFDHCGNPYLQVAYATAGAKIATLRTHLSAAADVLDDKGFKQHSDLLQFFRTGDFKAFDALMRKHVTGTRDNYVANLKLRLQGNTEGSKPAGESAASRRPAARA